MSDYDNEIADHTNTTWRNLKPSERRNVTAEEILDTPSIDAIRAKPEEKRNHVEEAILDAWGKWAGGSSQQCFDRVRSIEVAAKMLHKMSEKAICEVCWSSSWQPCEERTRNAVPDKSTGGWMICGFCNEAEHANNLRNELERYKAFYDLHMDNPPLSPTVGALKDIANYLIAENNRMAESLKQLQRINPACSAVDDLYAAIAEYGLSGEWIGESGATQRELPQKENFGLGD